MPDVKTDFSLVKFSHNLFSLVRCEVSWGGHMGIGYGDSLLRSSARAKAHGEAWERLWLAKLSQEQEGSLSSNGFAAGKTESDAHHAARMELIERAALLEAWREPRRWGSVRIHLSYSPLKASLIRFFGWSIEIFQILNQEGIYVLAGLCTHPTKGAVFDTSAGTSYQALSKKIMSSLLRQVLLSSAKTSQSPKTMESLPHRGEPADHASFYLEPAHLLAFEKIRNSEHLASCTLAGMNKIQIQTLPTPPGAPFVARATHPDWPQLTWGKQSIQGENPYPHPLA